MDYTCFYNSPFVHQHHHIGFLHKLDSVRAKDSGLIPKDSHNAFLHEMMSHISVNCCQRIIQQIDVLVLSHHTIRFIRLKPYILYSIFRFV